MMLFERLPVIGGKHPLNVRFLVENLAAQLVVGYHSGVAVVLQGAATHFQPCRHLFVCKEAFTAQSRTAVRHKVLDTVQQTVKRVADWATSAWFLSIISLIVTLDLVVHTK